MLGGVAVYLNSKLDRLQLVPPPPPPRHVTPLVDSASFDMVLGRHVPPFDAVGRPTVCRAFRRPVPPGAGFVAATDW